MFDLPDAKRIRRADLNRSRSSSPSSPADNDKSNTSRKDEEAQNALLQAKLAALLGPLEFDTPVQLHSDPVGSVNDKEGGKAENGNEHGKKTKKRRKKDAGDEIADVDMNMGSGTDPDSESDTDIASASSSTPPPYPNPNPNPDDPSEQEYDFLLFHSQTHHPSSQKIILTTSDELSGTGQILRPRPHSYFLAPKATGSRKADLNSAAVTGEDVLAEKARRHWGLEIPWRVRILRPNGTFVFAPHPPSSSRHPFSAPVSVPNPSPSSQKNNRDLASRTKPNKKRRIKLREKKRKREVAEEARRRERDAKEEEEREKRTRRNREKKVKRRMKEKAKKAEGGVEGGGDAAGEGAGGDE